MFMHRVLFFWKIRSCFQFLVWGWNVFVSNKRQSLVVKGEKNQNNVMSDQIFILSHQNGALVRHMSFQEKKFLAA